MARTGRDRRPGFTLIELIVVMALIIILAALAVMLWPSFGDSQKVVRGADRAGTALIIAKARAKRDGAPRGVRFFVNQAGLQAMPGTVGQVTEFQYIEQPDPWVPNPDQELNPNGPRIVFVYWTDPNPGPTQNAVPNDFIHREVYFVGNATEIAEFYQRVQPGIDMLVLPELHQRYLPDQTSMYRILAVNPPPPGPAGGPPYVIINGNPQQYTLNVGGNSVAAAIRLTLGTNGPSGISYSFPDLGAGNSGQLPTSAPGQVTATLVTYKFAIQPGPRPLLGEPMLQMGTDVMIDFRPPGGGYNVNTAPYNPPTTIGGQPDPTNPANPTYFDVLFAPAGNVMYAQSGLVCLWVRQNRPEVPHPRLDATGQLDSRALYDAAGEQYLVTVYTKTGLVATHPVTMPPPGFPGGPGLDPYQYAKDGANSGF